MNNKQKIIFLLILALSVTFSIKTYSQNLSMISANATDIRGSEKEIGLGWAMNTKYKYSVINLKYYTQRNIWKDRVRLRFDFEGYRMTKFIVPEYHRLLVQADYRVDLKKKRNDEHYLLPKAGFALIFDFYDEPSPTKWFSTAPNIGIDYEGRMNKLQLQLKNTVSFFGDGFWYELNPGISYKIYKNMYLKASMNMIMAYTYNGNSAVGLFPGISVNIFPNRKKTN